MKRPSTAAASTAPLDVIRQGEIEALKRVFEISTFMSNDGRKITGTAVVFNQRSENLGGYVEQIEPAAFDGCDMSDVRCLFNHNDSHVLGRTVSRTLILRRDSGGMKFDCDPPDTSYARDLAACMDRGDIDQCSFSFVVPPGGAIWSQDQATGLSIRTVKKISRLYDVSVVTFPAYPQTSSEIRSSADILSERQAEGQGSDPFGLTMLRRKLELAIIEHA